MDSIIQKLKDSKRRAAQRVLEKVGASDSTIDQSFENSKNGFYIFADDFDHIGGAITEFLVKTKESFTLNEAVAETVDEFYSGKFNRLVLDSWPDAPQHLRYQTAVRQFRDTWDFGNNILRRSMADIFVKRSVKSLQSFANDIIPSVKQVIVERQELVNDFDSYRRRLAAAQLKKEKNTETDPSKIAKLDAEVSKLEMKLKRSEALYLEKNEIAKDEIRKAKIARDEIVEWSSICLIVCQAELFARMHQKLQSIVELLPEDEVTSIRRRMDDLISLGGPEMTEIEKTSARKAYEVAVGQALPSDFIKTEEQIKQEELEKYTREQRAIKLVEESDKNRSEAMVLTESNSMELNQSISAEEKSQSSLFFSKNLSVPSIPIKNVPTPPPPPPIKNVPIPPPPPPPIKNVPTPPPLPPIKNVPTPPPPPPVKQTTIITPSSSVFPARQLPTIPPSLSPPPSIIPSPPVPTFPLAKQTPTSPQPTSPTAQSSQPKTQPPVSSINDGGTKIAALIAKHNQTNSPLDQKTNNSSSKASPSLSSHIPPFSSQTKAGATEIKNTSSIEQKMNVVIALYDCEGEADDELTFKTGDRIEILDRSDPGWWQGRLQSTGAVGLFPANYVQNL